MKRLRYSHLYYFNRSKISDRTLAFFRRVKILRVQPELVRFIFADIRNIEGELKYLDILSEINDICKDIGTEELRINSFLRSLGRYFNFDKVLLYFEKTIYDEIHDNIVFLNAVHWFERIKKERSTTTIVFVLEHELWSKYVIRYAAMLGIICREYRSFLHFDKYGHISRILSTLRPRFRTLVRVPNIRNKTRGIHTHNKNSQHLDNTVLVATWYTGRTVTFDPRKRSDIFWLLRSDLPREQVLLYFERKDLPATSEIAETLKNEHLKFAALSPQARTSGKVPLWQSSPLYLRTFRSILFAMIKEILNGLLQLRFIPWFYIINAIILTRTYSYWYDFFIKNGIKININPFDFTRTTIGMHLAIEKAQGISISYQWSNLSFVSTGSSSAVDILFSFGPEYKWIWESNRSAIGNLVYCGYITDHSFKEVRANSLKVREDLHKLGAKFIICYFDEVSSDNRTSLTPNAISTSIYKYFLERMLDEPTLGLVFKPGYPRTLYQRIAPIQDLIHKAKASGRCIFLDEGEYLTDKYPAEAAQASDLCVGLLISGTATLESFLAGTPTIFIDKEGCYSHPLYMKGKGTLVFDDLEDMFTAIMKYRNDRNSIPGFGDLTSWAERRDPFRDGNASLRMGQYIHWLYEIFAQGKGREEALQYANRNYADRWGRENVVEWRLPKST